MGNHRLYPSAATQPGGHPRRRSGRSTPAIGNGTPMSRELTIPPDIERWRRMALFVGGAGLILTAIGLFVSRDQFFRSYLWAFLFWFGLGMGCLPLLMLYHLVGGAWGFTIRRIVECGTRTIPVMAILFVPILFGVHNLYEWSHADR